MQYMSQGLPIAIIGYLMVFVVLCFLWVMLELMHFIIKSFSKENKNIKSDNTDINQYDDEPGADESELIAVFTAAIACSLNTSTYNLKIKSLIN